MNGFAYLERGDSGYVEAPAAPTACFGEPTSDGAAQKPPASEAELTDVDAFIMEVKRPDV